MGIGPGLKALMWLQAPPKPYPPNTQYALALYLSGRGGGGTLVTDVCIFVSPGSLTRRRQAVWVDGWAIIDSAHAWSRIVSG